VGAATSTKKNNKMTVDKIAAKLAEIKNEAKYSQRILLGGPGAVTFEELSSNEKVPFESAIASISSRPIDSEKGKFLLAQASVTTPQGRVINATIDPDMEITTEEVWVSRTQGQKIPEGKRNAGSHYCDIRIVSPKKAESVNVTTTQEQK